MWNLSTISELSWIFLSVTVVGALSRYPSFLSPPPHFGSTTDKGVHIVKWTVWMVVVVGLGGRWT